MKEKKGFDFRNSDDSIEDVASFEEARAIVSQRLSNLREDLSVRTGAEESLFAELIRTGEERNRSLMDLYACFYSPCKVSDTEYVPKAQGDMNDVMIDFSNGYEEFVKSMEEEYSTLMSRRRRAQGLLRRILSIPYPYSRVMYHFYYLAEEPEKISEELFISRATFYRIKSVALNILTSMYYDPENKTPNIPEKKAAKVRKTEHNKNSTSSKRNRKRGNASQNSTG